MCYCINGTVIDKGGLAPDSLDIGRRRFPISRKIEKELRMSDFEILSLVCVIIGLVLAAAAL